MKTNRRKWTCGHQLRSAIAPEYKVANVTGGGSTASNGVGAEIRLNVEGDVTLFASVSSVKGDEYADDSDNIYLPVLRPEF